MIDKYYDAPGSRSFLARHWRGEFSLVRSYWINGVLGSAILFSASLVVQSALKAKPQGPYISLAAILFLYILMLVIVVWQTVGIWRSAALNASRGGTHFWANVARIMVVIGLIQTGMAILTQGVPVVRASVILALGQSDIPSFRIVKVNNGRELDFSGGISFGAYTALKEALDSNPQVKIIHLSSPGGLINEAEFIADLIRNKGLTTYTARDCLSACTLVFLAGKERLLGEGGRLGFHYPSLIGSNAKNQELNDVFRLALMRRGVSKDFIIKALTSSNDSPWFPDSALLLRENVITSVVGPGVSGSPLVLGRSSEKDLDSYLASPIFKVVEQFDPPVFVAIKETLLAEMAKAPPGVNLQTLINEKLRQTIPRYLGKAPGLELTRYFKVQLAEMAEPERIDSQYCADFILGGVQGRPIDFQKLLPKSLLEEDSVALAALIKAASVSPYSGSVTLQIKNDLALALSRLELKRPGAFGVIANAARYSGQPESICKSFSGVYREILNLESPERAGAVLRFLLTANVSQSG